MSDKNNNKDSKIIVQFGGKFDKLRELDNFINSQKQSPPENYSEDDYEQALDDFDLFQEKMFYLADGFDGLEEVDMEDIKRFSRMTNENMDVVYNGVTESMLSDELNMLNSLRYTDVVTEGLYTHIYGDKKKHSFKLKKKFNRLCSDFFNAIINLHGKNIQTIACGPDGAHFHCTQCEGETGIYKCYFFMTVVSESDDCMNDVYTPVCNVLSMLNKTGDYKNIKIEEVFDTTFGVPTRTEEFTNVMEMLVTFFFTV